MRQDPRVFISFILFLSITVACEAAPIPPSLPSTPGVRAATPNRSAPSKSRVPAEPRPLSGLQDAFSGEPVISVALYPHQGTFSLGKAAEKPLLERLQDACAYVGEQQIPFQVRGAWVIAPENREEIPPEFWQRATAGRRISPREAVLGLSPGLMERLTSESGVALGALPKTAQESIATQLEQPMEVVRIWTDAESQRRGVPSYHLDRNGTWTPPHDWSRLRLRVQLRSSGLTLSTGNATSTTTGFMVRPGLELRPAPPETGEGARFRVTSLMYEGNGQEPEQPSLVSVPNTFKPSDLDGARYLQPIGTSGVFSLSDTLKLIERKTGLKLRAAPWYTGAHVFIGKDTLTAGEVLDGLRLAVAGTWRRIGDLYLLTWDRIGLRALQIIQAENTAALRQARQVEEARVNDHRGWSSLLEHAPYAPDDPGALTDLQRQQLFTSLEDPRHGRGLMIVDLTPAQKQHWMPQIARGFPDPATPMVSPGDEPLPPSDADMARIRLLPGFSAEVSVQAPGGEWVRWLTMPAGESVLGNLARIARKGPDAGTSVPSAAITDTQPVITGGVPAITVQAKSRGVIVPTLAPALVHEVAAQLKRAGFNTLFYPALYGGYATLPTRAFPLDPALREKDGLSAALAAAKANDLTLVAYVNALTWQTVEQHRHWISRYPGWLDVDAVGRTPLEWRALHPDGAIPDWLAGAVPANWVRPTEPQVRARLEMLVKDIAERKDVAGLAILDWYPMFVKDPMAGDGEPVPSPLGYAPPERLTALLTDGMDPVDAPIQNVSLRPALTTDLPGFHQYQYGGAKGHYMGYTAGPTSEEIRPWRDLAENLHVRAKLARSNWSTYTVDEGAALPYGAWRPDMAPPADIRVSLALADGNIRTPAIVLRPWPRGGTAPRGLHDQGPGSDNWPPAVLLSTSASQSPGNRGKGSRYSVGSPDTSLVLYDFRSAPGDIKEALQHIRAAPTGGS